MPKTESVHTSRSSPTRWLALGACLLAAAVFFGRASFLGGTSKASPTSELATSAVSFESTSPALKRIEDVRVGDYVVSDIDETTQNKAVGDPSAAPWWDQLNATVNPADWRTIELAMNGEAGDRFDITLLRPRSWLDEVGAKEGGVIELSLPEQGVEGPASVRKISVCPPLEQSKGRLVTGTVTHIRGGILNVYLDGSSEALGVTDNHPVFSVRHADFAPAGELIPGDQLRKLDGSLATGPCKNSCVS